MTKNLQNRLVVLLGMAALEIETPGHAGKSNMDLLRAIRETLAEATRLDGIPQMIRDEMERRAAP